MRGSYIYNDKDDMNSDSDAPNTSYFFISGLNIYDCVHFITVNNPTIHFISPFI